MTRLFVWGANSHGQLSLGIENEMFGTPQEVTFQDAKHINQIAGGGGHVLVKTTRNNLYSCGWNCKGQLGFGTTEGSSTLKIISSKHFENKLITSLHCGWEESAVICEDGSLFVWGSNLYGQLGQSKDCFAVTTPTLLKLPNNEKVKSIGFTFRCSVIVTTNGRGYLLGQVRHFDELKRSENCITVVENGIEFLKFSDNVDRLACGQNHFVFVDSDNSVTGFGANKYGQTDRVKISHPIDKLVCGWTHNGVLVRTGDILLWGRNNYGQLGRDSGVIINSVRLPIRLVLFEKFKDFYLGAEHGLAVATSGQIFTFGWNEHGNCGNGNIENVYKPYLVDLPGKCILAACGAGFCYALIEQ